MIVWLVHFALDLLATCRDIFPLVAIIFSFQFLVIRKSFTNIKKILIGFVYVILGVSFFLEGLDHALFPLGKLMASQLTSAEFLGIPPRQHIVSWQAYAWVYAFAACIGFASALAEPSLLAVAIKAEHISGGTIHAWGFRFAVAFGMAIGMAVGTFRIVAGIELYFFVVAAYVVLLIQTWFAPRMIVGLAYDSGGITTTTVTVPLVTALGLGLAQAVPGRSALIDGFGLIALTCLFPIMAVLGYAQIALWLSRHSQSSKLER